jgi:hypothetical protein
MCRVPRCGIASALRMVGGVGLLDLAMGGGADPGAQLALGRILLQTDPVQAEHVLAALAVWPRNAGATLARGGAGE